MFNPLLNGITAVFCSAFLIWWENTWREIFLNLQKIIQKQSHSSQKKIWYFTWKDFWFLISWSRGNFCLSPTPFLFRLIAETLMSQPRMPYTVTFRTGKGAQKGLHLTCEWYYTHSNFYETTVLMQLALKWLNGFLNICLYLHTYFYSSVGFNSETHLYKCISLKHSVRPWVSLWLCAGTR